MCTPSGSAFGGVGQQAVARHRDQLRERGGEQREIRQCRIATERLQHDHLVVDCGGLFAHAAEARERKQWHFPAVPIDAPDHPARHVGHRLDRYPRHHLCHGGIGQQHALLSGLDQDAADFVIVGVAHRTCSDLRGSARLTPASAVPTPAPIAQGRRSKCLGVPDALLRPGRSNRRRTDPPTNRPVSPAPAMHPPAPRWHR